MNNNKTPASSSGQSKFQDYEILSKLGQGSFGVVYKVKRKNDQKIYVLKQIDISRMSTVQRKEAVLEATILSKINNPYIVKFYDSFTDKNQINIIMEYCENGDLGIYLKKQMGKQLTESRIWKFLVEMCLGMQYLHANKILHRDIKTINMFLTKEDRIKIGDLGVAKVLNQTANFAHTVVGTPYYLSPELCEEKPYNHKSDIWSLGCVLYELCTLKHPFESNNQGALILKIVRGKYIPISSQYSKDLSNMVDAMLCKDYKKRPSILEILEKPIMVEKTSYFGYQMQKPIDLKPNTNPQPKSQPPPSTSQDQQKKINDAAIVVQQQQKQSSHQQQQQQASQQIKKDQLQKEQPINTPANRERMYYQNLMDKQKQLQIASPYAKKEDKLKPAAPNVIPSSYMDPNKKVFPPPPFITPQNLSPYLPAPPQNKNMLNNNQFDVKEYERRQMLQQRRPVSNQNQRPGQQQPPLVSPQLQPQVKSASVQQQQQQPKSNPINQRVKSGAPNQLSRQAQMAQKQGQKLIKQGDNERQQIIKPDIKALRPVERIPPNQPQQQQQPVGFANQKPVHQPPSTKSSRSEVQEVMNLPDDMDKRKFNNGNMQMKSNQEIIQESQRKKDALNRVNNKYLNNNGMQDLSNKSAEELHSMQLVVPKSSQQQTPSTRIDDDDEHGIVQKLLDDDEFAEFLGDYANNDYVQPKWNIDGTSGALRQTSVVPLPFFEECKDDDDEGFKVHHDKEDSLQNDKMRTIKEEEEGYGNSDNGSDTGYFSQEHEAEFNDRDERYDSEEEQKEYDKRIQQLMGGGFADDDEDNQPYDLEEEQRRQREEFGEDEEDEEDQEEDSLEKPLERISSTVQNEKIKELNIDIKRTRARQNEMKNKLTSKIKEGTALVGAKLYEECFNFFCEKASHGDDLLEQDMLQIQAFVDKQVTQEKNPYLINILFQAFHAKEELASLEIELQQHSQQLAHLESFS